jgi:uncharacterized membrane protein YdjX (TVP38/TMEM64 family)
MRKGVFAAWVAGILILAVILVWNREYLNPSLLANLIRENKISASVIYFFAMIVLEFFIIPTSPLVLSGAIIFSDDPFSFIIVTMVAILTASVLIYYFAQFVNLEEWLNKKYPKQFLYIQTKLNQYGFWIISGWSFLPLVSTSLICYTSGVIRYSFLKFITALFIGETIRICLYTFTASGVMEAVF